MGDEVGLIDRRLNGQARVDAFADRTGDHHWLHIDPERAADSALGGAITTISSAARVPSFRVEVVRIDFGSTA